jgi:uroporphyrinogen III methyltransferase/synthase
MAHSPEPLVYLVGAGPGHPSLLTLRAVECLRRADLVLYDRLVPERILTHAPPTARRVCVTELAAHHRERADPIQATMLAAARQGQRVVRLKGGDPFVFGRGGEEAEALRQAGIPYEIVPGVTAGIAAAVYAGVPLTHRAHASAVALVAGHEDPAKGASNIDWSVLAGFPGTLVVYMGIARLRQIAAALMAHGKAADCPAAVVQLASTGAQRTVAAPLARLPDAVTAARLESPAILLIGPVVALRAQLAWAERRPLFGKRVLVTRPRAQGEDLAARLEELGAIPILLPTVAIGEPADWAPVDRALFQLAEYDWLVFTSANGVHALVSRLRKLGRDLRALGHLRLAAIGPGTTAALRSYHLDADVVPTMYRSEALAAALAGHVAGRRVLLARADRGREVLHDELAKLARVTQVAIYSQSAVAPDEAALDTLRRGDIDYVLLTSSNIVRALAAALGDSGQAGLAGGRTRLVSISPVTSAVIREKGWPVAAEASRYTMEGVIEALVELATARGASTIKVSADPETHSSSDSPGPGTR